MTKLKTVNIKGKEYVEVKERIKFLSEEVKEYSIQTEYNYFSERKMWVVRAMLTINGKIYTGLAQEIESDNYKEVNHSSALENAETSAVGRACAFAGIGIVNGIASLDEIKKASIRDSRPKEDVNLDEFRTKLEVAKTLEELGEIWKSLPLTIKTDKGVEAIKNELKAKLK